MLHAREGLVRCTAVIVRGGVRVCVVAIGWCVCGRALAGELDAKPAGGWQLAADQRFGAGFDGNPMLSPTPDVRRDQGGPEVGPGPVLTSETALTALFGRSWWTGAQLDVDARLYLPPDAVGQEGRLLGAVRGFGGWRGTRLAALLALEAGRYDASFAADDSWHGRLSLRGEASLTSTLRLGAQASGGLRRYDVGAQIDRNAGGGADLTWQIDHWRLMLGIEVDRRQSDVPEAIRTELAPGLGVAWHPRALELDATYVLFARVFDSPDRDGVEHLGRLEGAYWVLPWLAPFLRGELGVARGETSALRYERWAVLAGVRVRIGVAAPPRVEQHAELATQGGAALANGMVRFRFEAPGARSVSVIGSFNGWDAEAGRLRPVGGGVFEGTFPVEPGRHRYRLLVDGAPSRPPGAFAYAPDDFGGEDAVLIVRGSL